MKAIAINGSPRTDGNTAAALALIAEELAAQDIETSVLQIGGRNIRGCIACGKCAEIDGRCILNDPATQELFDQIYAADALIIGSPVYYAGMNGTLKAFLDRLFYCSRGRMRHKVGMAFAVARRAGDVVTYDSLNKYFQITEMLVAPSYYWNAVYGRDKGEATQDAEGVSILRNSARGLAWLLKMKEATKEILPPPEAYPRDWTNFIR